MITTTPPENIRTPDLGGVLGEIVKFTLATAPHPNRELAIAGAIAFVAFAACRRYRDETNTRTNLYTLALAGSGVGKDQPRQTNNRLAADCGLRSRVLDTFRSGEAIEDALLLKARILFQYDEMDTLFASMRADKTGASESVMANMLRAWSLSSSYLSRRVVARNAANIKAEKETPQCCKHPGFCLYGTSTPRSLYENITPRMATNGLFARLLIFEADPRKRHEEKAYSPPPADLIAKVRAIAGTDEDEDEKNPANNPAENDTPRIGIYTTEGRARFDEVANVLDDMYSVDGDDVDNALWARAIEKVKKLALILALSDDPFNDRPNITAAHIETAFVIVQKCTKTALACLHRFAADTDYQRRQARIKDILRRRKGSATRSQLLSDFHEDVVTFDTVLATMQEAGMIDLEIFGTTKKGTKIILRKDD